MARPFRIGRHTHRSVPQAAPPAPEPTGVDYLAMVAAAHEHAAGTGAPIDFTQLAMFEDPVVADDSGDSGRDVTG